MKTIVIAPQSDDEVLGVRGTLLRRKSEGPKVAWLVIKGISIESGWCDEKVKDLANEIKRVTEFFDFDEVFTLNFPTTQLDRISMSDLVAGISAVFKSFAPEEIFVPPPYVHAYHRMVFNAAARFIKWFRYPPLKRVLANETLYENDFSLGTDQGFRPNAYVNVGSFFNDKLREMELYVSELGAFPFLRINEIFQELATLRGATSGFKAAKAFESLRERS